MKLFCVHSRVNSFKVGDIVKVYPSPYISTCKRKNCVGGRLAGGWILNSDDGLSIITGNDEPLATFKPVQKSLRKMMVRAFVKYAKERGCVWSRSSYNNENDWARSWANGYFNGAEPIPEFTDYFETGQQITQHDIDGYVDEEMSYL